MFGLQWKDQLEGVVGDELTSLVAKISAFLSVSHNEDGTLIGTNAVGGTVPIGSVVMWSASTLPETWLRCDGSAVSRITYKALFDVIGITYGAGDGVLSFNIPNLQQRFPIGKTGVLALGATGGTFDHTHTAGAHTHTLASGTVNAGGAHTPTGSESSSGAHTHTGSTGNESAHTHGAGTYVTNDGTSATDGTQTGVSNISSDAAHTHVVSGTSGAGSAHAHSISSDGGHTHTITMNAVADHTHTLAGSTGSSSGSTGTANPPYITLEFIIRHR